MHNLVRILLICCCSLYLPLSIAAEKPAAVAQWTSNVLLETLSMNSANLDKQSQNIKKFYTDNAWDALSSFLSYMVPTIKDKNLTLNPKALTQPVIVNAGNIAGINYWQITQTIDVPELNTRLDFTVIVIKSDNPSPYVIQSVNVLNSSN